MIVVLITLAIILLVIGHLCKAYRWKKFIEIYEKAEYHNLINGLSIGYIINYILPFRIGDIVRAIFVGRKMKNGISFSFATVLIDRILDVFVVAFIFILIYVLGFKNTNTYESMMFYIIGGLILLTFIIVSIKASKYIKKAIKKVASIFNPNIELNILKFSWAFVSSFKDMFYKLSKVKLLLSTIIMWTCYLLSYGLLAISISKAGDTTSIIDVFMAFFSKNNLDVATFNIIQNFVIDFSKITTIYIILPLVILFLLSWIIGIKEKKNETKEDKFLELLPLKNEDDRLIFLESYFSDASKKDYFINYLTVNRDVSILQDFSAGSNAKTMLCNKEGKTFFRKYAFGSEGDKLNEQIDWIKEHKEDIPLTDILKDYHENGCCFYDMPYNANTVSCFNYIHSAPIEKSWSIIESMLLKLEEKLYVKNKEKADSEKLEKYIDEKIIKNIKKLEKSREIRKLLDYDELIINGKTYKNLKNYKEQLSKENLYKIFEKDTYSDIHGDLTIENIICTPHNKEKYYLIDPNTGNLHNSPNLDYAKLLQSLHGNYEFFMHTNSVKVSGNTINYMNSTSLSYEKIYSEYKEYLKNKFSFERVKSIYFHEIVHWLRLLPYKIKKDEELSVLFYSGFIIILNDIMENYGGEQGEK